MLASLRIALLKPMVRALKSTGRVLGRMWQNMSRAVPTPMSRAERI